MTSDTPALPYVVIPFSAWWGIWDRVECRQACGARLWDDQAAAQSHADEMNAIWRDAHAL